MLMELFTRHRRLVVFILALLFVSTSFYLYYTSGDEQSQELPLRSPFYATKVDNPTNVTGPETIGSEQLSVPADQPSLSASLAASFEHASKASAKEKTMYIDVKGQVKQPGIYSFSDNERIADAIEKAGGFLPTADTLQVNLAQHLADGMYIIVPAKGARSPSASAMPIIATAGSTAAGALTAGQGAGSSTSERTSTVNLNIATTEQLATLPGIGKTRAEAILAYREQHGKFTQIEQLTKISGIGGKIFERLKGKISVD